MLTNGMESFEKITAILVDITILLAALVGVIKFRLYQLFRRRYRTEFRATHHELDGGKVIFEGDYIVQNTGERPIAISKVELEIRAARSEKGLLVPDEGSEIFKRTMDRNPKLKGLFDIHAGERSIFTIRCELPKLDDVVFVVCHLTWPHKREPSPFYALYVKKKGQSTFLNA